MGRSTEQQYLERIRHSLEVGARIALEVGRQESTRPRRELVREAELGISHAIREALQQPGEGWLCEEHADDRARLGCEVVWIVDPVDGTIEFINGLPEWSISIGLAIDGNAVAGGIFNPETGELFLGSLSEGVAYNGKPARATARTTIDGAGVLASRQEYTRGEWDRFKHEPFSIRPVGSVAYKLALVSAGLTDATWTLSPKHEWDVAAGVALVKAAGGRAALPTGAEVKFNAENTLLPGLVASAKGIWSEVNRSLESFVSAATGPRRK
jgi:myo-inositol-1(or 4)-monophosphatase